MALHAREAGTSSGAGGGRVPLSQGLLLQVEPRGKSPHPFAGICGLSMGFGGVFCSLGFF